MLKRVSDLTTDGPKKGLNTDVNILGIEKDQSPNMMNVLVDYHGSPAKRYGSNTQNSLIIANSLAAGFSPNNGALQTGVQSFWPLDEASGTRFAVVGSPDLSDNNSVGQSGGIKNQAALFNSASSQYLSAVNQSGFITGDIDFSISTWFYLNSTGTQLSLFTKASVDTSEILLCHFDGANSSGTILDSSIYTYSLTTAGNAAITTVQSKFGTGSLNLDGTGDFVEIPASSRFNYANGNFTIEGWVRPISLAGAAASDIYGIVNPANGQIVLRSLLNGTLQGTIEDGSGTQFILSSNASEIVTNTWTHVAFTESGNNFKLFINGSTCFAQTSTARVADLSSIRGYIGCRSNGAPDLFWNGYIDELQITMQSKYNADFTPPTSPYTKDYEYNLFVNSDNLVVFRTSSSGDTFTNQVIASNFGVVGTSTWYNVVAWHDTGNFIGISVNATTNTTAVTTGLRAGSAPIFVGALSSSQLNLSSQNFMNGRIDETGFWRKVLTSQERTDLYNGGAGNTYQSAFGPEPWASYDFGASGVRWLTVSAGTGVYASSNLGLNWVNIATSRTATYQYLQRSKNVLVATSDKYDTPLYWSGSVNTFMAVLNNSATAAKYSINFNGYLMLFNSQIRPRGVFYEDENTQLTGAWASNFDIPSTQDDEITASFILRRYLYVSTKYYLYRVNYVGGNPDFSYIPIKDWGFVPRTVKPLYIDGVGQIVMGMTWDKKLRLFDGSDDKIISNPVEEYNSQCDFAMDNISVAGSGLIISFAETDYNENVYKLVVGIGENSSQTTHMINFDGRSQAFYPYSRQHFNTMTMAESGGVRYLMAFDRSGRCHMMDSGNLDGNTTPIDDVMDSSLKFEKSPSQSHKGYQTDLFFANNTCGNIYYYDRIDYQNDWRLKEKFMISGSDKTFQIHKTIDVPESYNVYQYRITSSSGTMSPWQLNRDDHFNRGLGIGKNA